MGPFHRRTGVSNKDSGTTISPKNIKRLRDPSKGFGDFLAHALDVTKFADEQVQLKNDPQESSASKTRRGRKDNSSSTQSLGTRRCESVASTIDDSSSDISSTVDAMAPDFSPRMLRRKENQSHMPHPVIQSLMAASKKEHMLDVTLLGKDDIQVKVIRYVLACRNDALGRLLCPADGDKPAEVKLGDYSAQVLWSLFDYCIIADFPTLREETVDTVHTLVGVVELASKYQFQSLQDDAYQLARRLMNRKPSLACAIYDEVSSKFKEFQMYAIQTIQDCPQEALLGEENGVQYLSQRKLQKIIKLLVSEEENRLDEILIFHVLQRWHEVQGKSRDSLKVCQKAAKKLNLNHMDRQDLNGVVANSGFFNKEDIEDAIIRNANASPDELYADIDRVKISGAGLAQVNGLYLRQKDRDGQAMYTKGDIGLCKWEVKWIIGPVTDLSNMYYTCIELEPGRVPERGWCVAQQGHEPAPKCAWFAPKDPFSIHLSARSATELPACFENSEQLYGN